MIGVNSASPIRTIFLRVFGVLLVVYGVKASFDRNVEAKLILYYTFEVWNSDESFIKMLLDYLSIMAIYVCGIYYVMKIVSPKRKD